MTTPCIVPFSKIGEPSLGFISVAEYEKDIPFKVKRVFWTYRTPKEIIRGRHAHKCTEQLLIAVNGEINVSVEHKKKSYNFELTTPDQGVYLPTGSWVTMEYSSQAVQIVLASDLFNPKDYIYDQTEFENL
jgi:hypothetical protein